MHTERALTLSENPAFNARWVKHVLTLLHLDEFVIRLKVFYTDHTAILFVFIVLVVFNDRTFS